jgi:hypothetical protein
MLQIPLPHVEPAASEPSRPPPERRSPRLRDRARASRSDVAWPCTVLECSPLRARRSGPGIGLASAGRGERNFSSPQTLENKQNRVGISPNPPPFGGCRCNVGLTGPKGVATPRPFSALLAGNRRGGGFEAAKFSYPQPLEMARNGEGISRAVATRAGVQGNAASDSSGFTPQGRPEAGLSSRAARV